jgi:hypothetical protein
MLDLGCGPGGQVALARGIGIEAWGVDGDADLKGSPIWRAHPEWFFVHDFTFPSDRLQRRLIDSTGGLHFDLCWSCEFYEHVAEEFIENYMSIVSQCSFALFTAALGPGHHHVTCRGEEFWLGVHAGHGLLRDDGLSALVRAASTMRREFVRARGVVTRRKS